MNGSTFSWLLAVVALGMVVVAGCVQYAAEIESGTAPTDALARLTAIVGGLMLLAALAGLGSVTLRDAVTQTVCLGVMGVCLALIGLVLLAA